MRTLFVFYWFDCLNLLRHSPTTSIYLSIHPYIQQLLILSSCRKKQHNGGSSSTSTSIVPLSKFVSGWEGWDLQADRTEIKVSMFYINIYEGKPVTETLSQTHTHQCAHKLSFNAHNCVNTVSNLHYTHISTCNYVHSWMQFNVTQFDVKYR